MSDMYVDAAIGYGTFDPASKNYNKVPPGCPLTLWRLRTRWAEGQEGTLPFVMNEVDDGPPVHLRGPWPGLVFGPDARCAVVCDDAFVASVKRHPAAEVKFLRKEHDFDYTAVGNVATARRGCTLTWFMQAPCVATYLALVNRGERISATRTFHEAREGARNLLTREQVYDGDGALRAPYDEDHLLAMADYVRVKRARVIFNPQGHVSLYDERGRYVGPAL